GAPGPTWIWCSSKSTPLAKPAASSSFLASVTSFLKYFAFGPKSLLLGSSHQPAQLAPVMAVSQTVWTSRPCDLNVAALYIASTNSSRSQVMTNAWRTRGSLNGDSGSRPKNQRTPDVEDRTLRLSSSSGRSFLVGSRSSPLSCA